LLILFGIRNNCKNSERNLLVYLSVRKAIIETIYEYNFYQLPYMHACSMWGPASVDSIPPLATPRSTVAY
jgi:hypothetical protein